MPRTARITEASMYGGPFAVRELLSKGYRVICHDSRFADNDTRESFVEELPRALLLKAVEPEAAFINGQIIPFTGGAVFAT